MKRIKLQDLTVDQLVERFVEIGLDQDRALLENDVGGFNRLFDQMQVVNQELKSRAGDQRRALLSLYKHPNLQVRLKAAKTTLAIAPQAARDVLEAIKDSKMQPQALDAGMSLRNLDQGIYKPT
jgi:hypothetical protein